MKRVLLLTLAALLLPACVHRWVGRPVTQLEKEYGSPRNIQNQGENRVYVYPDLLAGRGQMTFTVDRRGIIRSWCATAEVPGPWSEDIYGNPVDGPFNSGIVGNGADPSLNAPRGPNGPGGLNGNNRSGSLPPAPVNTCR